MDVSVALSASAVTICELAVPSCLMRQSMAAESVVTVILSASVTVARLAIASVVSISLLVLFAWPNVPCLTAVFFRSS